MGTGSYERQATEIEGWIHTDPHAPLPSRQNDCPSPPPPQDLDLDSLLTPLPSLFSPPTRTWTHGSAATSAHAPR